MVDILPMVDMALDPEDAEEFIFPTPASAPKYPFGLSISLCDKELDKLDIDFDDVSVGDMVHLHAMGVVTSKSCNETEAEGPKCRLEIQLTHVAAEDEAEEDKDQEEEIKSDRLSKLYK